VVVSEELQTALIKASELVEWISVKLDGVEMKSDDRHRVPALLFDVAIDHHQGIIKLLDWRNCASAFALLRCEFECFVRGAWLHYCANDDQIESFIQNDRLPLDFAKLIDALEQQPSFQNQFLSVIKDQAWKAMNSYTHGGTYQISRRLQDGYIESNFEDAELLEVIQFSGMMAVLTLNQIATLADRQDIVDESQVRFISNFPNLPPLP